jgi:hypothetical protein
MIRCRNSGFGTWERIHGEPSGIFDYWHQGLARFAAAFAERMPSLLFFENVLLIIGIGDCSSHLLAFTIATIGVKKTRLKYRSIWLDHESSESAQKVRRKCEWWCECLWIALPRCKTEAQELKRPTHQTSPCRNRMRAHFALAVAFLAQATAAVPLGQFLIQSVAQPTFHVRHCNFVAYAIVGYPGDGQDFNFTLVPGKRRYERIVTISFSYQIQCYFIRACEPVTSSCSAEWSLQRSVVSFGKLP